MAGGGIWHSNNQKNKGSLLQAFVHTMKVGRIIDCICEYLLYMRCHFILNDDDDSTETIAHIIQSQKTNSEGKMSFFFLL